MAAANGRLAPVTWAVFTTLAAFTALASRAAGAAEPRVQSQPPASAPGGPEYQNVWLGAIADFGYGSSMVGDSLLGELGGQFTGIQSFRDRALLVQWNGLLAARGGILGNTKPYTELIGGHAVASAEAGYRWRRGRRWSPYTGANLNGDLTLLDHPGTSFGQLNTLNDLDGVGGFNSHGAVRVDAGASWLAGAHSLLLVAFFQETVRAAGVYTPGITFSELGLAARWDVARRLTLSLEGLAGRAPSTTQPSLATIDQKTDVALSAVARKLFANGMWLGATSSLGRQMDHRAYPASGTTYDSADAWTFEVTVFYGFPLGPWKAPAGQRP
jgi:hypothetical protein